MKMPLQITFKGIPSSPAIATSVREHATRLAGVDDRIVRSHGAAGGPRHRHHTANPFGLRIVLTVPGDEIVVSRDPGKDHAREDMNVAIRDAFNAATRQLEDYARRRRGDVKTHAEPLISEE